MKTKIIITGVIIVGLIVGGWYWQHRLQIRNDEQRLRDVEDIMQILVEMRTNQPEWFSQIVGQVAAGQIMIGKGADCTGSFGSQCLDEGLKDACLDLTQQFSNYMDSLLVDPDRSTYGIDQTGYYLRVNEQILEVGACNPKSRSDIVLDYKL